MTGPVFLYESRLNDAVPVASTTAAGFDVLNLRDLRDYSLWKPSAMPATVTIDCGSSKAADYMAIYSHDLFTNGCTIEVRKSTDNFVANDVLVDTHTPTDDKPILRLFASTSSRYWRIRVLTGSAPTLAIALLGNRLEVPAGSEYVKEGFDPLGREIRGQDNRSVMGRAIGTVIDWRGWKSTLMFESLSWAWVRSTWEPAAVAWLEAEPFLFCWNPDTYPKETRHAVMDRAGWKTPHKAGSYADLSVPVTGIIP